MEHVVFFPAHDGTPAFRRVTSLEEAVRLVEHLRNVEGVAELSVHALTEVPLAFKAFYRVEVPTSGDVDAPMAEVPGVAPEEPVVAVPAQAEAMTPPPLPVVDVPPVEAPVAEQTVPAMAGDAPSSLGFFAS